MPLLSQRGIFFLVDDLSAADRRALVRKWQETCDAF